MSIEFIDAFWMSLLIFLLKSISDFFWFVFMHVSISNWKLYSSEEESSKVKVLHCP